MNDIETKIEVFNTLISLVDKSTTIVNSVPVVDSAKLIEQLKHELLSFEVQKEEYLNSILLDEEAPF